MTERPPVPTVDTDRPYTTVYTDGSSTGKVGPGGWAWAVLDGPEGSGGALDTTNQRMELQAAHEAMLALPGLLLILSDSAYVVRGANEWWPAWEAKGWRKVSNVDLWQPFLTDLWERRGEVRLAWIKGHAGYDGNERADTLAKAARAAITERTTTDA